MVMEHFWQNIPNYFTSPDSYTWMATAAAERGWNTIVIVGVYKGACAAYMAVELDHLGCDPKCKIDLVDHFENSSQQETESNLAPVAHRIGKIHRCLSWDGASFYADNSVDCVYIDAGHDYASVSRDIDAWGPKVRPGGVIGGHDYREYSHGGTVFGVIQAVKERGLDKREGFRIWPGIDYGGDSGMVGEKWPTWIVDKW